MGLYTYLATKVRVIDGDTIEATVDQGFHTFRKETFRLARINAPEINTDEGGEASRYLGTLLCGADVTIESKKTEKYGRWLAEVWVDGVNINDLMVKDGHAAPYTGKKA